MAGTATKERLQQDAAVWFADGIIEQETLTLLQERYESQRFGWIGVVKYLGVTGGVLAFFGIIGLVTAMVQSAAFGAVVLGLIGGALTYWALQLAGDVRNRYATSSKIVLTLGVVLWTSSIGFFVSLVTESAESIVLATGLLSLPISFFLAYHSRNSYLLIVSLLGSFHWLGSWNAMLGRSTYGLSIQEPAVMSLAALAAVAVGIYHERHLYPRLGRFFLAWQSLGLVYLNMSLLILSIWDRHESGTLVWIVVFTAATLAQIVLGAAWQSGLMRGYGITFFAINIFTRYHELFWDQLGLGLFLLAGGGLLVAVGVGTEITVRAIRAKGGAA